MNKFIAVMLIESLRILKADTKVSAAHKIKSDSMRVKVIYYWVEGRGGGRKERTLHG